LLEEVGPGVAGGFEEDGELEVALGEEAGLGEGDVLDTVDPGGIAGEGVE